MNTKRAAVAAGVALVAAVVVALLVVGSVPVPAVLGGDDPATTTEDRTVPTTTSGSTTATTEAGGGDGSTTATTEAGDGSTTATTTTADQSPFTFDIDEITECGSTCRDVTVTLENRQDREATGVTVTSRIWAGNGTDGDPVWTGTEDVGRLAAGESYTATKRVDLSFGDAYAIDREDGWITVETTVETDDRTTTFTERWNVA